jgi:hypothetical protein
MTEVEIAPGRNSGAGFGQQAKHSDDNAETDSEPFGYHLRRYNQMTDGTMRRRENVEICALHLAAEHDAKHFVNFTAKAAANLTNRAPIHADKIGIFRAGL